ncbi:hypothetical protein BJ912DRAFT_1085632 [Pholiota molesta]|nr:hypothetical protein BJ912DRAFT_1085632 [Pholiota molesta]
MPCLGHCEDIERKSHALSTTSSQFIAKVDVRTPPYAVRYKHLASAVLNLPATFPERHNTTNGTRWPVEREQEIDLDDIGAHRASVRHLDRTDKPISWSMRDTARRIQAAGTARSSEMWISSHLTYLSASRSQQRARQRSDERTIHGNQSIVSDETTTLRWTAHGVAWTTTARLARGLEDDRAAVRSAPSRGVSRSWNKPLRCTAARRHGNTGQQRKAFEGDGQPTRAEGRGAAAQRAASASAAPIQSDSIRACGASFVLTMRTAQCLKSRPSVPLTNADDDHERNDRWGEGEGGVPAVSRSPTLVHPGAHGRGAGVSRIIGGVEGFALWVATLRIRDEQRAICGGQIALARCLLPDADQCLYAVWNVTACADGYDRLLWPTRKAHHIAIDGVGVRRRTMLTRFSRIVELGEIE